MRHPHHVVRQDVSAREQRQRTRPAPAAPTSRARRPDGGRAVAIASCSPLLLSDPGHGYCAVVRSTRATMTGGTLVAAGMMTMNIAVYGFNVVAARAAGAQGVRRPHGVVRHPAGRHRRLAGAAGRHGAPPRGRSRPPRRDHRRDRPGHGHRRVGRRRAGRRVDRRPDTRAQARQLLGGDPVRRDPRAAHRHGRRVGHRPGHGALGRADRDLRRQRLRPSDRRRGRAGHLAHRQLRHDRHRDRVLAACARRRAAHVGHGERRADQPATAAAARRCSRRTPCSRTSCSATWTR